MAISWDDSSPLDNDIVSQFPANERASRNAVRDIFDVDHHSAEDDDQGFHDKVTLVDAESDPTFPAGVVGIWNNDGALKTRTGSGAAGVLGMPSGTRLAFQQSTAPTGWTKDTSLTSNSAFRFVTGSVGTGGVLGFAQVFSGDRPVGGSTANHTLTVAQMPEHNHDQWLRTGVDTASDTSSFARGTIETQNDGTTGTFNEGGGQPHSHGSGSLHVNMAVRYIDLILAEKD